MAHAAASGAPASVHVGAVTTTAVHIDPTAPLRNAAASLHHGGGPSPANRARAGALRFITALVLEEHARGEPARACFCLRCRYSRDALRVSAPRKRVRGARASSQPMRRRRKAT